MTLAVLSGRAWGQEPPPQSELSVEQIARGMHPIEVLGRTTLGGGITIVGQGLSGNDPATGGDGGQATASVELFLDTVLTPRSRAFIHLDVQQGSGFRPGENLPVLLIGPNGNPTGPNNDVESFEESRIHLDQAYVQVVRWGGRLIVSGGQIDPTGYVDTNRYTGNERFQFLANQFANNPTIEFGGSPNFYGLGLRLTAKLTDRLAATMLVEEGDGDYADAFSRPFWIGELDLSLAPGGREGGYRFYVWQNRSRHFNCLPESAGGGLKETLMAPAVPGPVTVQVEVPPTAGCFNASIPDEPNEGVGVSLDQALGEHLGVWTRAGVQDDAVAQFDRHLSFGAQLGGILNGRTRDAIGIAYGMSFLGDSFKSYLKSTSITNLKNDEKYIEVYYRWVANGDGEGHGLTLSPDIQWIGDPGGRGDLNAVWLYALRAQVFF